MSAAHWYTRNKKGNGFCFVANWNIVIGYPSLLLYLFFFFGNSLAKCSWCGDVSRVFEGKKKWGFGAIRKRNQGGEED